MALEAGTRLGPYEIVELRGKGGMGEVYRARDTRLDRDVAVKVLPSEFSQDETYRKRLEREAKTISRLQHPNVCMLLDIGSEGGAQYLVMEYLEGETLEARLKKGALPLPEMLLIGREIAEAMEAAHRQGVVHRDLKPSNVMLTEAGTKVLDFGLAKGTKVDGADPDAETETVAQALTKEGRIVGTVPYMAPEQLEGKPADARTDLWALGCVLYEMATGSRPFGGETQASLIGSIMGSQPEPVSRSQPLNPERLDWVVSRCLEKDPERRWQSSRDVSIELEAIAKTADQPSSKTVKVDGPSIVVLPFVNMSADPDQEYFCDGMAEEVINALTQLEGLHVVARTSAFSFKGRDVDIREIGDKLGVRSVLEGSVRKAGDRLRVTAQLINVEDGYHLWSERFDRQLDDVFAIQDEISSSIVDTLRVKLALNAGLPRSTKRTESQEAYDLYLRGMHYFSLQTEWRKAIECFEQALSQDPDYAAALAGIALAYTSLSLFGILSAEQAAPRAEAAAKAALEKADSLSQAHQALAKVRVVLHWDWTGGEREYRRAILLNPGDAALRVGYASTLLSPVGRTQEALAEVRRAHELDPLSVVFNRILAETLYWDRQYDGAIRQVRNTIAMAPDLPLTRSLLALACASNDMPEEALRERQEILRRTGREKEAQDLEAAYREAGEAGMLRWYIHRGLPKAEKARTEGGGHNRAWNMALLYGRLGETDQAIAWLEEAIRHRHGLVIYAKVHPWLDSLRDEPRYHAILQTMNLAD